MASTWTRPGGTQQRPSCEWMLAAASAQTGATQREIRGSLKPDAAFLTEFRKIWNMSPGKPFIWKSHTEQLGWVWKLGGTGPQGPTSVEQNSVSQVDGVSDMATACRLCSSVVGGLRKCTRVLPTLLSGRKLPPSFCSVARQFSFSLYVSVAFQCYPHTGA